MREEVMCEVMVFAAGRSGKGCCVSGYCLLSDRWFLPRCVKESDLGFAFQFECQLLDVRALREIEDNLT
jgi:hypothetical protein